MGLLIQAASDTSDTKMGGLPTGVSEFEWPACRSCKGAMQFLAQIKLADSADESLNGRPQVLLLFQCQNEPGMCDEWDANAGGNAACLASVGTAAVSAPETGDTTLSSESFVTLKPYDSSVATESEDDNYIDAVEDNENILGKIGGDALWLQGDETPDCDCGNKMHFVAQLEERGGGGINFGGGGVGYAFVCGVCEDKAKFLWQS